MHRVILARHGTHAEVGVVLSGRSDIGLTTRGHAEAAALADALGEAGLASLHTSPRRRARETIAPLAARTGCAARIAPALDEIDFGRLAGRSFADLDRDADWQHWNARREIARCPGGETMAEAIRRAAGYLYGLATEDFPALCVTHCDIIRGLVADRLGLGMAALFAFDCDPASFTTLDLGDSAARIVGLNEHAWPPANDKPAAVTSAIACDAP